MPPKHQQSLKQPVHNDGGGVSKKRKDAPTNASNSRTDAKRPKNHQTQQNHHRAKQRDARTLSTQLSSTAFKHGELDVQKFVKAREYEIRALEEGMERSKKALTTRAFQQVPKDLRRRTASHNVKRVPKRLQRRAKREMVEDNTPTVTARRRKPTRHMRLRLETIKKLRALGAKAKTKKAKDVGGEQKETRDGEITSATATENTVDPASTVRTRAPKIKKAQLAAPPVPKAKFRKRQINKTWLPTHMFHAKRARMTPHTEPLWRFAIPLTPTAKSYRPTHRSANQRGAVAWDVSYMGTIGLEGQQRSIEVMLKSLGVGSRPESHPFQTKGEKWKSGVRAWEGFLFEREAPHKPFAPATVIWSPSNSSGVPGAEDADIGTRKRNVLIRTHPAAFQQLWEEVVRLGKVAKPQVLVEDLRFELGSIEIAGPGSTEALLGALWPSKSKEDVQPDSAEGIWTSLAGLHDPALLPPKVLLGFHVQDPRLHHPPRTVKPPATAAEQDRLLDLTANWPLTAAQTSPGIFTRRSRFAASSALPTQKGINRRKAQAAPGQFPASVPGDPCIPILLYSTSKGTNGEGSWVVLLPWKCVQPVWYSIMYYPLSTGGQPRFGGLDEKRQLAFETNRPWFPGDFPGTNAGWAWEINERQRRKAEWDRKPKGKRIAWDAVDLGNDTKGEIGLGWACDWERLLTRPASASVANVNRESTLDAPAMDTCDAGTEAVAHRDLPSTIPPLTYLLAAETEKLLLSPIEVEQAPLAMDSVITVALTCLSRGTPTTCARIYRLPSTGSSGTLRKQWLSLHPRNKPNQQKGPKYSLPRFPKDTPAHVVQRQLVRSLLQPARAGEAEYPCSPLEEDLIGFITTGNFNLGEGRGTGIGNILLSRVLDDVRRHGADGRLCIVRNAGHSVGRLAQWELV